MNALKTMRALSSRSPVNLGCLAGLAILCLAGCGSGDGTLAAVDPNAAPLHPRYADVEPILQRNCAPCHSDGESDFAEDDDDYSTCAGARAGAGGIEDTVLEGGSMPPGAWPRLSEREKLILGRWIADGAPCGP